MKPRGALDGSATTNITPAVLAIGRPMFPQALLGMLRQVADVGHCMVFSFDGETSARCLLDIGNIPTGSDLGAAYSGHFHFADPNRDTIFDRREAPEPVLLPNFARRMYSNAYRKIFFEDSRIVDKFATAIWVDKTCYYVNFYRIVSQGRFTTAQSRRLLAIAPAVSAVVARHFQHDPVRADPSPAADPADRLETLFATAKAFARLTRREKDVCLRIVSGMSSEAISTDLGISLHSTLTYRKRAYDRLGIGSQNELFAIVLRHGMN